MPPLAKPPEKVSGKLRKYSGLLVLLLLVAAVFAPVDVPFTLESVAKALPVQQWILLKTPEGVLSATLHNHLTGTIQEAESYQFQRGDMVEVKFVQGREQGTPVKAGETIASIYSNELNAQLVRLRNQLAIEQANKQVVATGQKQELIRQLKEQINLAQEDLKLRQKTLDRTRGLYEDGLVALVDMERAENAFNESAARVKVAEETLRVAATGEKAETVTLASSKISSLQKEIDFLESTQDRFDISAPFPGKVRFESLPEGDRLFIEDTAALVLFIPIRLKDRAFVKTGQQIELKLLDGETIVPSTVLETGERVEILGRDQVVVIKALVEGANHYFPTGMPVRCQIRCGEVRVAEFLKRSVRW